MMGYLLVCLGYVAIRQELIPSPYAGCYHESSSGMLWLMATTEVFLKVVGCPVVAFADAANYISSWDDGIQK